MQIGSIGDFVFSVSAQKVLTWQTAGRNLTARFARHSIFGRKPLLEYTGPEVDSMTLGIHLNTAVGIDPNDEMQKLEEILLSGTEQMLIIGGRTLGWYVVEGMQETLKRTNGRGKVIVADISLTLTEYNREAFELLAGRRVVNANERELLQKADALGAEIEQSELGSTFKTAQAACESVTSTALDVTNGITEAVMGSVSSAIGFIAEASNTALAAANVIMAPANVALAAMQSVLQAAESIAPLGLEGASQRVNALQETTALTGKVQELVRNGPEAVSASLADATNTASSSNLSATVKQLGAR